MAKLVKCLSGKNEINVSVLEFLNCLPMIITSDPLTANTVELSVKDIKVSTKVALAPLQLQPGVNCYQLHADLLTTKLGDGLQLKSAPLSRLLSKLKLSAKDAKNITAYARASETQWQNLQRLSNIASNYWLLTYDGKWCCQSSMQAKLGFCKQYDELAIVPFLHNYYTTMLAQEKAPETVLVDLICLDYNSTDLDSIEGCPTTKYNGSDYTIVGRLVSNRKILVFLSKFL